MKGRERASKLGTAGAIGKRRARSLGRNVNEQLVLATSRTAPRHGYQIALAVEEESDGAFELQHGTLYPILHRLEKEELIEGGWEDEGRRAAAG